MTPAGRSPATTTTATARTSELLKVLGVDSYRFSISWPRVLPTGSGAVNAAGLDFYDRLVDELLEAGIEPTATLFHWDTPQALEDLGGWTGREITEHFAAYATVVGERLGDRVARWMPLNEPNVVTMLGHAIGNHAPGRSLGFEALPVAHHLLLGHGLATQALRAAGCQQIGIASNHAPVWPASQEPQDVEAAELYDNLWNWLFADPVLLGRYPVDGTEQGFPTYREGDLDTISEPLDWFGINYYNPALIGAPGGAPDSSQLDGAELPPGLPFENRRDRGLRAHRLRLADRPGGPRPDRAHLPRPVCREAAPAVRHREWLLVPRRRPRGRPGCRPSSDRLPRRPPPGAGRRDP